MKSLKNISKLLFLLQVWHDGCWNKTGGNTRQASEKKSTKSSISQQLNVTSPGMVTILKEMGQISLRRKSGTRRSVSDLLLLMGFIVVPLSLCVGELVTPALADFLDHCPKDCNCKWANGKREADCTRAGFTAVPTHLDHEIQVCNLRRFIWFLINLQFFFIEINQCF